MDWKEPGNILICHSNLRRLCIDSFVHFLDILNQCSPDGIVQGAQDARTCCVRAYNVADQLAVEDPYSETSLILHFRHASTRLEKLSLTEPFCMLLADAPSASFSRAQRKRRSHTRIGHYRIFLPVVIQGASQRKHQSVVCKSVLMFVTNMT